MPWRVAAPFARGLAAVALEAALLVGWPVGWALATCRFVETGEARVLLTLGERPLRTALRLAPQGALLALALAAVALVYGSDASAPGRVATELVAQGRASCARVSTPTTYAIPFTDMTWLCAPDRSPRLVGRGPGAMRAAVLTASDARIAGDFRALELDDARLLLTAEAPQPTVAIQVASLSMRGMAPWAQASTLPACAARAGPRADRVGGGDAVRPLRPSPRGADAPRGPGPGRVGPVHGARPASLARARRHASRRLRASFLSPRVRVPVACALPRYIALALAALGARC